MKFPTEFHSKPSLLSSFIDVVFHFNKPTMNTIDIHNHDICTGDFNVIFTNYYFFQAFFQDFIRKFFDNRRVLKDFDGCGKRYERQIKDTTGDSSSRQTQSQDLWPEPMYAECMWDCEGIHGI